jgi:hypothetical protein
MKGLKLTPRGEWAADILALVAGLTAIASFALIYHLLGV